MRTAFAASQQDPPNWLVEPYPLAALDDDDAAGRRDPARQQAVRPVERERAQPLAQLDALDLAALAVPEGEHAVPAGAREQTIFAEGERARVVRMRLPGGERPAV